MKATAKEVKQSDNINHKNFRVINIQPPKTNTYLRNTRNSLSNIKTKKPDIDPYLYLTNTLFAKKKIKNLAVKTEFDSHSPRFEVEAINLPISTRSISNNIQLAIHSDKLSSIKLNNNTNNTQSYADGNPIHIKHKTGKITRYAKSPSNNSTYTNFQFVNNSEQTGANQAANSIKLQVQQFSKLSLNEIPEYIKIGNFNSKKCTTTSLHQKPFAKLTLNDNFLKSPTNPEDTNLPKNLSTVRNSLGQTFPVKNANPNENFFSHSKSSTHFKIKNLKGGVVPFDNLKDAGNALSQVETEATNDTECLIKRINSTLASSAMGQGTVFPDNTSCVSTLAHFGQEQEKTKNHLRSTIGSDFYTNNTQRPLMKSGINGQITISSLGKLPLGSIDGFPQIEETKTNDNSLNSGTRYIKRSIEKLTEAKIKAKFFDDVMIKQIEFDKNDEEEEEDFLELYNMLSSKLK